MNNQPKYSEQDWIDLLAEGELEQDERDQLFKALDKSDGGWKRCALALLETQALAKSLGGLELSKVDAPSNTTPTAPIKPVVRKSTRTSGWLQYAVGILSACFLVGLGFAIGNQFDQPSDTITNRPSDPQHPLVQRMVRNDSEVVFQFDPKSIGVNEANLIAFVGANDGDKHKIYPVIESEDLEKQLLNLQLPTVPPQLAARLARDGWQVQAHKQLVSYEQGNGDRKTVPIGMLNYRFVGRETF